ncbi:AraC family transcriptional regulator [Oxalobacteraceae bacterium OM1]|nr:AraC family transcriptional regulator [Oxalobacteraceae bacterium OM1]
MNYRRTDTAAATKTGLPAFQALPRPVYGHVAAPARQPIGHHHSHPWAQLSYAARGVIEVKAEEGSYIAPPLCAVWIPARIVHRVQCSSDAEIHRLYVDPHAQPAGLAQCQVLAVTPLLRELIRAFSRVPVEYDEGGPDGRLAQVLLDQLAAAPKVDAILPWPQDARLRKLCAEMHRHPDRTTPLAGHADRLGVSEKSLSRMFVRQTGLSFRAWRQRSRLMAALPLLQRGDRVTDVAIACGYDSMSAFIAAFRERFKATPGQLFHREERTSE